MRSRIQFGLALLLLLAAGGCVPFCGTICPDEPPRWPIEAGEHEAPEPRVTGDTSIFEGGTDYRLLIDRENGAATLSFLDAQGRTVEIDYLSRWEEWRDFF